MNSRKILSFTIGLIFIGIAVYLSLDIVALAKNLINKLNLGWVSSNILARVLVCLAFARGLQLLMQTFKPNFNGLLVFIIGIFAGFGLSFISPIYESDYGDYATADMVLDHDGLTILTNGNYKVKDQPYIVAFFTTSCPHCKAASQNIGLMSQQNRMIPVIAIFPGNKADTEKFLTENNGQYFENYMIDSDEYFIKNSGGAFPSVFLINKDGETMKHWFGDLLNYTALDYLESLKQ
ncbi:MAG: TlpA family protein disulfide reductase [Crocinitomicaceae bacterium]